MLPLSSRRKSRPDIWVKPQLHIFIGRIPLTKCSQLAPFLIGMWNKSPQNWNWVFVVCRKRDTLCTASSMNFPCGGVTNTKPERFTHPCLSQLMLQVAVGLIGCVQFCLWGWNSVTNRQWQNILFLIFLALTVFPQLQKVWHWCLFFLSLQLLLSV